MTSQDDTEESGRNEEPERRQLKLELERQQQKLELELEILQQQIASKRNNTTRLIRAEKKAAENPEKAKPAWDVARVTLEAYFNRNLTDIRYIFFVSVAVIIVGFIIIAWGITRAIQNPDDALTGAIAAGAGVIIEIVGATLLKMYQSAINQAMEYTETLERINAVGMAMQILDTMPDDATPTNLKDETKAKVIESLMLQHAISEAKTQAEAKK